MVLKLQESSRDSSVGIATLGGRAGRGLDSRGGGGPRFSAPVHTGPGAQPAVYTIPGDTAPEERRYPPTPSSVEVKERVVLYSPHRGYL
jgi:hypothetical protein